MNPSLPGLPIAVTASGVPPGAGLDIQTNQSDSEASNGFDGVLAQLVSGPAPVTQDAAAVPVDARQLFAGLQELPQGGKLLPLLQQTLDRVAASGIDLKKFVADLAAKLKVLSQDTTKDPAQQLALALQQLVQEQPALKPVLPADLLDAMAQGMTQPRDPLAIEAAPPGHSTLANVAHKACDRPADLQQSVQQSIQQAIQQSVARDAKPSALDTAWTQLQQTTALPEGGAADIAVLTAAFKRLLSDNRSASSEALPRAESLLAGASPITGAPVGAAHAAPAAPTVALNTPFGQADWDQALGERIQWLASQKVQGAQVKLNPANLGPMEVRIQMQNDQASIQFTSHHALVREALEAALPRLRDMFEASGVQLVNVDVSSGQSFAQQQQAAQDSFGQPWSHNFDTSEPELKIHTQTPLGAFVAQGRLDLFA
jgi:flagellar hook-length control protein FliK